jgi:hypothetical protein
MNPITVLKKERWGRIFEVVVPPREHLITIEYGMDWKNVPERRQFNLKFPWVCFYMKFHGGSAKRWYLANFLVSFYKEEPALDSKPHRVLIPNQWDGSPVSRICVAQRLFDKLDNDAATLNRVIDNFWNSIFNSNELPGTPSKYWPKPIREKSVLLKKSDLTKMKESAEFKKALKQSACLRYWYLWEQGMDITNNARAKITRGEVISHIKEGIPVW